MYCAKCGGNYEEGSACPVCGQSSAVNSGPAMPKVIPLYCRSWFILLVLVFFFPAGLYLLWKAPNQSKAAKITVSAVTMLLLACALLGGGEGDQATVEDDAAAVDAADYEDYDFIFKPDLSWVCEPGKITINGECNCPDGAVIWINLMSFDGEEIYMVKAVVKDKKFSAPIEISNSDIKGYNAAVCFGFHFLDVVQPENVEKVYGERGERLIGRNVKENEHDGITYKHASSEVEILYPSEEAVEEEKERLFQECVDILVNNSNGFVISVEKTKDYLVVMQVTNDWYLLTPEEKKYYAETSLGCVRDAFGAFFGDDGVSFRIIDENSNNVADSKLGGGMRIKE